MSPALQFVNGMAYVPIPKGRKGPTTSGWNLSENCLFDEASTKPFPKSNWGLAHAYCSPITCALDIDHLPSTLEWFLARGTDLRAVLSASGAALAESGRPHSLKAFYALPDPQEVLASSVVKEDGQVIFELRCGTNDGKTVCDVIPPSVHPSGSRYRWTSGSLASLQRLPDCFLAIWKELLTPTKTAKAVPIVRGLDSPRRVALLRELLRYIDPSCDYETWRDIVFSILSSDYGDAENIAREWSEGSGKFEAAAFTNLIKSYRAGSFTLGTVYHYARVGGYND